MRERFGRDNWTKIKTVLLSLLINQIELMNRIFDSFLLCFYTFWFSLLGQVLVIMIEDNDLKSIFILAVWFEKLNFRLSCEILKSHSIF